MMKFKVETKELSAAVSLLMLATAKKEVNMMLSSIKMKVDGSQVVLSATDMESLVVVTLKSASDVEGDGETLLVPGSLLNDALKTLKEDEVVSLSGDESHVLLKTVAGRFTFGTYDTIAYPSWEEVTFEDDSVIRGKDIVDAWPSVSYAVAKNDDSKVLNGINLTVDDKGLTITATDGSRMALYHGRERRSEKTHSALMPKHGAMVVRSAVMYGGQEDDVTLSWSLSQLKVSVGNVVVYVKTMRGRYPNIINIIPRDNTTSAVVDKALLLKAIKRCRLFGDNVKVVFEKGHIMLEAAMREKKQVCREVVPCSMTGGDMTIGFSSTFMEECISHMTASSLVIEGSTSSRPVKVMPVLPDDTSARTLSLLMPVLIV